MNPFGLLIVALGILLIYMGIKGGSASTTSTTTTTASKTTKKGNAGAGTEGRRLKPAA